MAMNDRETAVLGAALRIICVVREVLKGGKRLARTGTLELCVAAYDDAVRKMNAPSALERVQDPDNFEGDLKTEEPPPERTERQRPIPEWETHSLYRSYYMWEALSKEAELDVKRLAAAHADPSLPPSDELARAYNRVFRAQDVMSFIARAISEAMAEHVDDAAEEGKVVMKMRTYVAPNAEMPNADFAVAGGQATATSWIQVSSSVNVEAPADPTTPDAPGLVG